MFLCDDCQIRSICKIYDNIIQYRDIIALSECGARNLIDKQQNKSTPIFNEPEVDIEERIAAIQKLTPEIQEEINYIKKSESTKCQDCKKENTDLLKRQNNTYDFNHKIYFDKIVSLSGNW